LEVAGTDGLRLEVIGPEVMSEVLLAPTADVGLGKPKAAGVWSLEGLA
jgi:hypothetical protein